MISYAIINYTFFDDTVTGIYRHAAPRYHARPKAKHGLTVLSVDEVPYSRQQTWCNNKDLQTVCHHWATENSLQLWKPTATLTKW